MSKGRDRPHLLVQLRKRQATMARPPKSCGGDSQSLQSRCAGTGGRFLPHCHEKYNQPSWRDDGSLSDYASICIQCFPLAKAPTSIPCHPDPHEQEGEGKSSSSWQMKERMPRAGTSEGRAGCPRPPESLSQSVMRNWGLGIGSG